MHPAKIESLYRFSVTLSNKMRPASGLVIAEAKQRSSMPHKARIDTRNQRTSKKKANKNKKGLKMMYITVVTTSRINDTILNMAERMHAIIWKTPKQILNKNTNTQEKAHMTNEVGLSTMNRVM